MIGFGVLKCRTWRNSSWPWIPKLSLIRWLLLSRCLPFLARPKAVIMSDFVWSFHQSLKKEKTQIIFFCLPRMKTWLALQGFFRHHFLRRVRPRASGGQNEAERLQPRGGLSLLDEWPQMALYALDPRKMLKIRPLLMWPTSILNLTLVFCAPWICQRSHRCTVPFCWDVFKPIT